MAKLTALRLAEKPKEKAPERKGRSLINNNNNNTYSNGNSNNTAKNIPNSFYKGKPTEQSVKLPKVPNSSSKNI